VTRERSLRLPQRFSMCDLVLASLTDGTAR
jgi:hypothetical protein